MSAKEKIRVVLDTSAMRGESLSSGPFEALARLAEAGYVEVVIPEVVVREFTTLPSNRLEAKSSLTSTVKTLKKNLPSSHHGSITELESKILKTFDDFEVSANAKLKAWMARVDATVVAVGPAHGASVVQKYFEGTPPFKAVKNRNDFPDAFIVEAILEVATDATLVVARDGGVASALSSHAQIHLFGSVTDLLDSDDFDDLKSEVEIDNVAKIATLVKNSISEFTENLDETLSVEIGGSTVSYHDPWNDDAETLYIDTAGPVLHWHLDLNEHEYLGEGVISIPFTALVEVSVDTSTGDIFQDDLHGTSEDAEVAVEGTLSIVVDDQSALRDPIDWNIHDLIANSSLSIDEVAIKLKNFERGSTKWSQDADE